MNPILAFVAKLLLLSLFPVSLCLAKGSSHPPVPLDIKEYRGQCNESGNYCEFHTGPHAPPKPKTMCWQQVPGRLEYVNVKAIVRAKVLEENKDGTSTIVLIQSVYSESSAIRFDVPTKQAQVTLLSILNSCETP